jgi:NADH:ubiquinone oxidoreductase subunit 2 (subunit N)
LLSLILAFGCFNLNNDIIQFSFQKLITACNNYFTNSFFISSLILCLSGLPPMFIFFLKTSIFINIFTNNNYALLLAVIINSIIGVFFYVYCFNTTNLDNDVLISVSKYNTIANRLVCDVSVYYAHIFIVIILFFNYFGFFFFFDFFVIISSFIL